MRYRSLLLLIFTAFLAASSAPARAADEAGDGQSLGSKAVDPTALLGSITVAEAWTADYWGLDRDGYTLRFRPAIPFTVWGVPNIMRVSLAFDHGGLPGYGLEDVQIFDLVILPGLGGKLAFGPLVNLSAATSRNPSPFAIGPAVGYVYHLGKLNIGAFNQNLFGDHFGTSQFQPVLSCQLEKGFDVSAGDLQLAYDWEREEWTSLPLGAQLGYLAMIHGQPMRFYVNPQYNFRDLAGSPRIMVQAGAVLLLP